MKNPSKADIAISSGSGGVGQEAILVEVPKNPDKTHPHRRKDALELVNAQLAGAAKVNSHDLYCVNVVHKVSSRAEFYYKSKFASPQYSQAYVDWLLDCYGKAPDFFADARIKRKAIYVKASGSAATE